MDVNLESALKYLLFFILTSLILLFMNCQSFVPISQTVNSSQCKDDKKKKALATVQVSKDTCDELKNYTCDHRVFKPDVADGEESGIKCFKSDKMGEVCLEVNSKFFSTKGNQDSEPENSAEFAPGGDYNREEFVCVNNAVVADEISLFSAESDVLESSFSMVYESCLEKVGTL